MRIIGGAHRGLKLAAIGKGDPSAHLRPTSDRVREALFNVLMGGAYGDPITGARVLDLFAGSGALGLEALSRGAAHATLVDNGAKARALLRENIDKMRAGGSTQVLRRDATRLGAALGTPYTLAFLDPPYGTGLGARAILSALAGGWIAPGAVVVWEDATQPEPVAGLVLRDARRYGDTWITFLETGP